MTNQEFRFWINGYLTLTSEDVIDHSQIRIIINHANLVAAVSNELDDDIKHFVSQLESEMKHQLTVSLDYFKKFTPVPS